jgi:GNAT superfamily N-acetyltransferase
MAQLVMKRPGLDLGAIPDSPDVRVATTTDAEGLARVFKAAFPEMEWDAARARKNLLDADDVKETFVVEENGQVLGTASARYFEQRFPGVGYVHRVAVDPVARGRGLFDTVMAAVHRQFIDDSRTIAFLETDDHRLPAIAAYLRLGYVPQYTEADHEGRWSAVFTELANSRRSKR